MAGRKSKQAINDEILDSQALNKARKIKYDAERIKQVSELERLKKEKLQGSLVELKLVQETFTQIASQTKADLYRLVSILPPKLIGLQADEMTEIVRDSIDEILTSLYNGFRIKDTDINYEPEPEFISDEE